MVAAAADICSPVQATVLCLAQIKEHPSKLDPAMKSILLPVDQSEQMPSALETAWQLAQMFDATIEGVALRPAFAEIVAPDPIVAVTIPPADWNETDFVRTVRQTFDAFAARHAAEQGKAVRFRWRGGSVSRATRPRSRPAPRDSGSSSRDDAERRRRRPRVKPLADHPRRAGQCTPWVTWR